MGVHGTYTPESGMLALGACPAHGFVAVDAHRAAWQRATLANANVLALELHPEPADVAWLVAQLVEAYHAENNARQVAACLRHEAHRRTPRGLPVVHPSDRRDPQPARVGGADCP